MLRGIAAPYLALPREVYVLCAGTFVNRAGSFVVPFLALYLSQALGFDATFATLVIGVYGAGSVLASFLGGALADRFGRRPVMIFALAGSAAALLLFSTLTTKGSILAGIALFAVIGDLYRPAAQAMLTDLVPSAERPKAYALLYVSINLGFAVGAFAGGMIAKLDFRLLFWGDAATSVLFALILAFSLTEPARSDTQHGEGSSNREALLHMVRNLPFVALCASSFLLALLFHQAESTLPLYTASLGIGPDRYGQIMAVNGVLITVLQLPAAHWFALHSRSAMLAIGAVIIGVGFGLKSIFTTPILLAVAVATWTLGEILFAAFHAPVIGDLAPERFRARYFGVIAGTFGAAMMFGPPLGGLIIARWGPQTLWLVCLGIGLLSSALMLLVRRGLDTRH